MTTIQALIDESPPLQAWADGTPANWAVAPEVLRFIVDHVKPGMSTLETGAGQTTIAFAIARSSHTAITLDIGEAERIRAWCAGHQVSTDELAFLYESSDQALPRGLGVPAVLDFVFIDGAHRFPFPCMDWHYTESRLRVGGVLGVDDYAMPSVRVLYDFLMGEDEWELTAVLGRTALFRRVRETVVYNDCQGQRINQLPWTPFPDNP
ncbi:class I SAM-dependent methyltransferase [Micromonospora sp. STR1s_5]|nr:class I SAM-dependent methyltransferase [Micromonospora sp. STR1s_5]